MRPEFHMNDEPWEREVPDERVSWRDVISAWLFVAAVAVLALLF